MEILIFLSMLCSAMVFGLLPAYIAKNKGRDFNTWWIYGTLLFIIALPHSILTNKSDDKAKEKSSTGQKFWSEKRDVENNSYKLYLIKKYNIEKNEVLAKYVVDGATYETLEEVIEKISIFDEQQELKITTSSDFVKNTGEISGFAYTEYGDGSVKLRLSRNKFLKFESMLEALKYFKKSE